VFLPSGARATERGWEAEGQGNWVWEGHTDVFGSLRKKMVCAGRARVTGSFYRGSFVGFGVLRRRLVSLVGLGLGEGRLGMAGWGAEGGALTIAASG
jgi:hypothetical protein